MLEGNSNLSSVVARLEKLEKQNRRFRQTGIALCAAIGALLVMGQASRTRTVEAQQFVLKDANGNAKGSFDASHGEPQLTLMSENGVLTLMTSKDGPSMLIIDKAGFGATLGVAHLTTAKTGETHTTSAASVTLLGKDGKVLWQAP